MEENISEKKNPQEEKIPNMEEEKKPLNIVNATVITNPLEENNENKTNVYCNDNVRKYCRLFLIIIYIIIVFPCELLLMIGALAIVSPGISYSLIEKKSKIYFGYIKYKKFFVFTVCLVSLIASPVVWIYFSGILAFKLFMKFLDLTK